MNGACGKSVSTLEKAGVKVLYFYSPDRACYSENDALFAKDIFTETGDLVHPMVSIPNQAKRFVSDADGLFSNKTLFAELAAAKFDLCILDGFLLSMNSYIIPYKLDIPYVSLTTSFYPYFMGVPALPSFSPSMLSSSTDRMTFLQRLQGTIEMVTLPSFLCSLATNQDSFVTKYAPEKPFVSLTALMRRSKLWLLNTDPVLDFPRASLPHVVNIGGLSTVPPKPLPQDLQVLMDGATKGAVILSFGSLAKNLPEKIIRKILHSFEQFPEVTYVMKYNGPTLNKVAPNIHPMKWLPQNDLLAHPSVKLFITHSGNNGQFEALYHGIPMIGLPLFGDQIYNANRMEVKGFGIAMKTFTFAEEELVANIRTILNNDSYKKAIGLASEIYRSRYHTARERAVYWIEHVLTYDSSYLVSYGTELPWYQYWLVDVFMFLFFVGIVAIMTVIFVLSFCYRLITSGKGKQKKQ